MIRRRIYSEIEDHLNHKEITIIVGPRQVGKTTLLRQLQTELTARGSRTIFFNLDYQTDFGYFQSHDRLLAKIKLEFGGAPGYVFIDEIQRLLNAGLFLKGIYDLDLPYKLIVTGSGSIELKEKIKESLTGRKRMFNMLPVSFLEYTDYETGYDYSDRLHKYLHIEQTRYKTLLNEYLIYGGYPRIATEKDPVEKRKLMDEIFSSYIEKDLVYLLHQKDPQTLVMLFGLLAARTGQLLNFSELASHCGISVALVKKYFYYFENTFSVKFIKPFYSNFNKEITKSPVPYFLDTGLRNFLLGTYGHTLNVNDSGYVFQNLIYVTLLTKLQWSGNTIHFWRSLDKAEVDFVINKHSAQIPVEVKYSSIKKVTLTGSLRSFIRKYSPAVCLVINIDFEAEVQYNGSKVYFIPFYRLIDDSYIDKFIK
jgi:predicted AAA+ superfamily ATPase